MMKRNQYLILIVSLLIGMYSCEKPSLTNEQLTTAILEKYKSHKSLSYHADYQMKFFSGEDTNSRSVEVDLVKLESDTNFKGMIWIQDDSIVRYYDGQKSHLIRHNEKKIMTYPEGKNFIFTGNIIGDVTEIYFLKPERLENGIKDTTISTSLKDSVIDGKPVHFWRYEFEDGEDFKNSWKNIAFDVEDLVLNQMHYYVEYNDESQFNHWVLSDKQFDQVSKEDLEKRFQELEAEYEVEVYTPPNRDPLADGEEFTKMEAVSILDGKPLDWNSLQGKITLVDFWYMDCMPCIKAIPAINKLAKKYPEMDVLGLNPFDSTQKGIDRMPSFLENNPMEYSSYFISRESTQAVKVMAYPTLYILDADGKVLHSKIGYGDNSEQLLDSLIQLHL